jgi:hypothetical protein
MAGSAQFVVRELGQLGRPFWLPPAGWGNGLDDDSWAAVLDVNGEHVANVLMVALLESGVPAYAAVVAPLLRPGRRARDVTQPRVRIWVGASRYGRGQTTILRSMPVLVARYGPGVLP